MEKKSSNAEPSTPDIMSQKGGKSQKYQQSKLAQSAVFSNGQYDKSPIPKGKGKKIHEKTIIEDNEMSCLITCFMHYAKSRDEYFNN